ncbi:hypothetical protein [Anaerolentibacter hominis]|uniref:hypothetical protein n=1 Tax=Anaerolentibacter hominis TaxID=3079009 RepID=UPI0031B894C8
MDIYDAAYDFSVRVAELVRYLNEDSRDFPLCGKLLDCGVGAGLSVRDNDCSSAARWIRQADYIIEMAAKSGYLTDGQSRPIREVAIHLLALLDPVPTKET